MRVGRPRELRDGFPLSSEFRQDKMVKLRREDAERSAACLSGVVGILLSRMWHTINKDVFPRDRAHGA